ncbi:MAG: acylneuraminate cytidylyltransferase family protein [Victivallales bacterium]|nr:acylneuraminate cytidylyltransferase family protein [Victivallales bacterium]
MASKVMALITARGGSVGLKNKNILPLAGKPVLAWTVTAARAATLVDRVVVSTDSDAIAAVARTWGAEVPFMRPEELATSTASHNSVIMHAVDTMAREENYHPDYLLLLQPTSPLRTAADIDAAIRLARESDCDGVVSVCAVHNHPLLMNRIDADGFLTGYLPDRPLPGSEAVRRQNLPPAYADNGAIYLVRTAKLRQYGSLRVPRTRAYIMPEQCSFQIDSQWELELIEYLLTRKETSRP